jgi:hypothetical protein
MLDKTEMLAFLKRDMAPALGCTEPACVAIAAATAMQAIGGEIKKIDAVVNSNIYKNGMSVSIPKFPKMGLDYAVAIGALIGDPSKSLQILQDFNPDDSDKVIAMVEAGNVKVDIDREQHRIYVKCDVTTTNGVGTAVILGAHTNVVLIQKNGVDIMRNEDIVHTQENTLLEKLLTMKFSEMRALVETASAEELKFLHDGAEMNEGVAQFGLENEAGIGVARVLNDDCDKMLGDGLMTRTMLKVSSAIEARLNGCPMSVMSSAGSGSKGVAMIIPIVEIAKAVKASEVQLLRALALGHLLNSYINAKIGKLVAMCTCVAAASTAASVSMTWLMGGNDEQMGWAVRNMTGAISGMICDGGKVGCSLKQTAATSAAFMCARMAVQNVRLRPSDGICGISPEQCIDNMARVGHTGMSKADDVILDIMLEKNGQVACNS